MANTKHSVGAGITCSTDTECRTAQIMGTVISNTWLQGKNTRRTDKPQSAAYQPLLWPGTCTWELAFPRRKPVFFPSTHTTNFMPLFPVTALLFPKLIYLQRPHFSQQFRSKWIVFPFVRLLFIWSIFALLSVISVCYCLLCIQMHLLSGFRVSNSFQPLSITSVPCPPQHLLSNLSRSRRIFHTFVFLAKGKNISFER